jgi:hypothetical protein
MNKGYGLVEVDRGGHVVHELKQRDRENEMHHAIVVTPRDTVLPSRSIRRTLPASD